MMHNIYQKLSKIQIRIIPILQDNYSYLVVHDKKALIIDPAEPSKIIQNIPSDIELIGILCTHYHWDHSGGNEEMKKHFNIPIYGGDERIPMITDLITSKDEWNILNIGPFAFSVLLTPCHTKGCISFLFSRSHQQDTEETLCLFTGDTLFSCGCGRFFEGTAIDMLKAIDKISCLPSKNTWIYPGHEYTLKNIKFAITVDNNNPILLKKQSEFLNSATNITIPSLLETELSMNPFMRTRDILLQKQILSNDECKYDDQSAINLMATLRQLKDNF